MLRGANKFLTSVGGDDWKFVAVSGLVVQGGADAHLPRVRFDHELLDFPEIVSQCVVDHCVYATVGIRGRDLQRKKTSQH